MNHYFHAAADTGADLIISACSSVGDLAEEASKFLPIPLLRIDHAMIKKAIETGNRIGVLASLNTTLNPTVRYVYSIAEEMNKQVEVISCVADGAYEANNNGNSELHDKLLEQSAIGMVDKVDVLILAQGSMAKMEQRLHEITGIPVYSSPKLCALEAKELLEEL